MITSVDTNILIDIFLPDPVHGPKSLQSIEDAYAQGSLIISNIVYAELVPQFSDRRTLDETLKKSGIEIVPVNNEAVYLAGNLWLVYRKKSKKSGRIITDFLIGAFAMVQSDRFLTRDRGFCRDFFKGLKMV